MDDEDRRIGNGCCLSGQSLFSGGSVVGMTISIGAGAILVNMAVIAIIFFLLHRSPPLNADSMACLNISPHTSLSHSPHLIKSNPDHEIKQTNLPIFLICTRYFLSSLPSSSSHDPQITHPPRSTSPSSISPLEPTTHLPTY